MNFLHVSAQHVENLSLLELHMQHHLHNDPSKYVKVSQLELPQASLHEQLAGLLGHY